MSSENMLDVKAAQMVHHLSMAFGGQSQVPWASMACAIAGQINNQGLGRYGTVSQVCDAVLEAWYSRDEDDSIRDLDEADGVPEMLISQTRDILSSLGVGAD